MTRPIKTLLCCLLFACSLLNGWGQGREFVPYQHQDGLPENSMNFQIVQDHQGFIWGCGRRGMYRYDGHEFSLFNNSNGLHDPIIIRMAESHNGKMYGQSFSGHFFWVKGDSTGEFPISDSLLRYTRRGTTQGFRVERDGSLTLSVMAQGVQRISPTGKREVLISKQHHTGLGVVDYPDGPPLAFSMLQGNFKDTFSLLLFDSANQLIAEFPKTVPPGPLPYRNLLVETDGKGTYYVAAGTHLWRFTRHRMEQHYEQTELINSLDLQQNGDLLVATMGEGALVFKNGDLENGLDSLRTGERFFHWAMEDREGGFWLSASLNGLLYAPYADVHWYTPKNSALKQERLEIMELHNNELYFSDTRGNIHVFDGKNFRQLDISAMKVRESNAAMARMYSDRYSGNLWVSYNFRTGYLGDNEKVVPIIGRDTLAPEGLVYRMMPDRSGDGVWALSKHRLLKIRDKHYVEAYVRGKGPMNTIAQDSAGRIYLGGETGLLTLENGRMEWVDRDNELLNSRGAVAWMHNRLWFRSWAHKMMEVTPDTIYRLDHPDMTQHTIHAFVEYEDRFICLNETGDLMEVTYLGEGKTSIRKRRMYLGKLATNPKDLAAYGDHLYVTSESGLFRIDRKTLFEPHPPPTVLLERLQINEVDTNLQDRFLLPYDQNFLRIRFNAVALRTRVPNYRYRLHGFDDGWRQTTERSVQYTNLPPGSYRFEVRAQNEEGTWSEVPAGFDVVIDPPFWATWWFRTLVVLAAIALTGLGFQWRYRRLNERRNTEQQLIRLESQALRAQMNPHFIFNVLGAIQGYVSEQNTAASEIYLGKFSRLIRLILENSREPFIALDRELETLRYYLDMEKMRFRDQFEYRIEIYPDLDPEQLMVPPMLIQPYLENAVKHGLSAGQENGELIVVLSRERDDLICRITDNGIGRKASALDKATNDSGHQPLGMMITRERLRLLNDQSGSSPEVSIRDLDHGTEVTLRIPLPQPKTAFPTSEQQTLHENPDP